MREIGDKIEIKTAWLVAYLIYCGYQKQEHINDGYVTFRFPLDAIRKDAAKNEHSIAEDIDDFQMFRALVEPLKYMGILQTIHGRIARLKFKNGGGKISEAQVNRTANRQRPTANGASA